MSAKRINRLEWHEAELRLVNKIHREAIANSRGIASLLDGIFWIKYEFMNLSISKNVTLIALICICFSAYGQGNYGKILRSQVLNSSFNTGDTLQVGVLTFFPSSRRIGPSKCHRVLGITIKDTLDFVRFDIYYDQSGPMNFVDCWQSDTIQYEGFHNGISEVRIYSYALVNSTPTGPLDTITNPFSGDTILLAELGQMEVDPELISNPVIFDYMHGQLYFSSSRLQFMDELQIFNSLGQLETIISNLQEGSPIPIELKPGFHLIIWKDTYKTGKSKMIIP